MKIGIIGANGRWAQHHIRIFESLLGSDNVKRYDIADGFVDWPEPGEVDAISVVTPIGTHADLVVSGLTLGCDVLVEKPMCVGSAKALYLHDLALSYDKVLMVDHTFLYSPPCRKFLDMIKEGVIGDLVYMQSTRMNPGSPYDKADVLWDLGPHDLSIMLSCLGTKPGSGSADQDIVTSVKSTIITKEESCDIARATYKTAFGVTLAFDLSWVSARKIRRTVACGTKGMLVYDDLDLGARVKMYDGLNGAFHTSQSGIAMEPTSCPEFDDGEPLTRMAEDFVKSCQTREEPVSSSKLAVEIVRLLEMVEQNG